VEERNGKTYVKFSGNVDRNVNKGEQLVVDFKGGGQVTLSPPPRDERIRQRRAHSGFQVGAGPRA
jgi:uncharacterized protein (AIM24 family)